MKDMKLTAKERTNQLPKAVDASDGPSYPYGLQLHLNDEELEKLNIKNLPKVGKVVTLEAKARVTGIHAADSQSGKSRHVDLQITHLDLELEPMSAEEKAESLYGR